MQNPGTATLDFGFSPRPDFSRFSRVSAIQHLVLHLIVNLFAVTLAILGRMQGRKSASKPDPDDCVLPLWL